MSAAALAGWASDDPVATPAAPEAFMVEGHLEPFHVPTEWAEVRAVLDGTTYELAVDDMDGLVLLTGMEPGWEEQDVLAEATIILEQQYSQQKVIVLKMQDLAPLFG